jgi:acyl-CoA thioesterase FadM
MSHVHVDTVRARHDELDAFGMVRVSACVRWLAQAAADASAAVGFGPDWYEAHGLMWLVRRTTLALERPIGRDERVTVRTFVEDFRRVRSHRAYELHDDAGHVVARGRTDWVMIQVASARPVRVPQEIEAAFGAVEGRGGAPGRPAWKEPPEPEVPARMSHVVRFADLDSLAHVNNATYLDLLVEAAFGHFATQGWNLDRFRAEDRLPWVQRVDVEYLEAAVFGDTIDSTTWMAGTEQVLHVHHRLARGGDGTSLVRAETGWAWRSRAGAGVEAPGELLDAVRA